MNQSKVVSSNRIPYCPSNQCLVSISCGSVEVSDGLGWRIKGDVCTVLFGCFLSLQIKTFKVNPKLALLPVLLNTAAGGLVVLRGRI